MIALCFVAFVPGSHAALHPADSDVYFEVSDVRAVIRAYESAPVVKFVTGAPMAKVRGVTSAMGFDLDAVVTGVRPIADTSRPDDPWWPWSAATHVSGSVSGLGQPATKAIGVRGIVDFADAASAHQALAAIEASSFVHAGDVRDVEIGGAPVHVTTLTSPLAETVGRAWCFESGSRIVFGAGAARAEDYAAVVAKPESSLATKWKSGDDAKDLGNAAGTTIVDLYSDLEHVAALDDLTASLQSRALLRDVLLSALVPFVGARGHWRTTMQNDRFVTDAVFARLGSMRELDTLGGARPLDAAVAKRVPKEALGAWITTLDPERVNGVLSRLLAPPKDGSPPPAGVADEPSLAQGLGSSLALFVLPIQGIGVPRVVASFDLVDAAKFRAGLEAWIAKLGTLAPNVKVEAKNYHKVPLFTFSDASESNDTPSTGGLGALAGGAADRMRPTIGILSDRVVIALATSTVWGEIRRSEEKEPTVHAIAADGAFPADAFEASTMDWSTLLAKAYDMARGFAPMAPGLAEKHVDFSALPTGAELFAPFRATSSWSRRLADGRIRTHSESSFGPETPLGLAGLMAVPALLRSQARDLGNAAAKLPGAEKSTPDPNGSTPATPDVRVEQDATTKSLRQIRTSIAVYKSQLTHLPASLDDLTQKTDAFPNGFIADGKVPLDGWGHAFVYSRAADGAKYELYSRGPDGVDDHGAGDDVRLP